MKDLQRGEGEAALPAPGQGDGGSDGSAVEPLGISWSVLLHWDAAPTPTPPPPPPPLAPTSGTSHNTAQCPEFFSDLGRIQCSLP